MTAYQLLATLPVNTLNSGCTVTLEAINPSTGATVTGVTVSLAAFYGLNMDDSSTPGPEVEAAPLPLFLPLPELNAETA